MQIEEAGRILLEGGCLTFLEKQAEHILQEIERMCPEGAAMLSPKAKSGMADRYRDRMLTLYLSPLLQLVKDALIEIDPIESICMSGENKEAMKQAAEKTADFLGSEAKSVLIRRYPLIEEYSERIEKNYIQSQISLLNRLLQHKDAVSKMLFGGERFKMIRELSGDAGDIHRHGQCVQRIVTDAGTCYYKPHDLSPDVLFHALTERWFPDCIKSAATVCGEGYGFVEELKHTELSAEQEPGEYYYHLGILTALFHALGSTDMHQENILAVGTKPAAIDLETLMRGRLAGTNLVPTASRRKPMASEKELAESVELTCVLPLRIYKGGMMGVLFCEKEKACCQPFRGENYYGVGGFEPQFLDGFRDGYSRIQKNKKDMEEQIMSIGHGAVRYVIRNTAYYYYIRSMLFSAKALSGEAERNKVLKKLSVAYAGMNDQTKEKLMAYEINCLTEGDIPYYCSAADGRALCGFDQGEILIEDFWEKNALERAMDKLHRFSEAESEFERSFIRASLEHAPRTSTGQKNGNAWPVSETLPPFTKEEAASLCREIFKELNRDKILTSDGIPIWHSGMQRLEMDPALGILSLQADAAFYCSILLGITSLKDIHPDAEKLANECLQYIALVVSEWEKENPEVLRLIPLDRKAGLGGLVRSLSAMQRAGMKDAGEVLAGLIRAAFRAGLLQDSKCKGAELELLRELCLLHDKEADSPEECRQLICNIADTALSGERPREYEKLAERGLSMALTYRKVPDDRYLEEAKECFRILHEMAEDQQNSLLDPLTGGMALDVLQSGISIPDARSVHRLVLDTIRRTEELQRSDSLRGGNAFTVIYLLQAAKEAGDAELVNKAGQILAAMSARRKKEGHFIITPPGIRSFFDVSLIAGTTGIGLAAVYYLGFKEDNK